MGPSLGSFDCAEAARTAGSRTAGVPLGKAKREGFSEDDVPPGTAAAGWLAGAVLLASEALGTAGTLASLLAGVPRDASDAFNCSCNDSILFCCSWSCSFCCWSCLAWVSSNSRSCCSSPSIPAGSAFPAAAFEASGFAGSAFEASAGASAGLLLAVASLSALAFAADESLSPALPFAAMTGTAASPRAKIHVASTRIHFLLEIWVAMGQIVNSQLGSRQ